MRICKCPKCGNNTLKIQHNHITQLTESNCVCGFYHSADRKERERMFNVVKAEGGLDDLFAYMNKELKTDIFGRKLRK